MKTYTKEELTEVIRLHKLWLDGDDNGSPADLRDADLRDADLSRANLREADLRDANLSDADLRDADLRDANLSDADLRDADLRYANLRYANLSGANLSGALYNELTSFFAIQCPEEGQFIAWKKCCDDIVVKLLIPEDAKRSSATSRKCRASKAVVLDIFGADTASSQHDPSFTYTKGKTVEPTKPFDDDRWNECGSGIHFFITRQEAENY